MCVCVCGGGLLSRLWNLCKINSGEGVFPLKKNMLRENCTRGEFTITPHFLAWCQTFEGKVVLYLDRHGAWGKKEV